MKELCALWLDLDLLKWRDFYLLVRHNKNGKKIVQICTTTKLGYSCKGHAIHKLNPISMRLLVFTCNFVDGLALPSSILFLFVGRPLVVCYCVKEVIPPKRPLPLKFSFTDNDVNIVGSKPYSLTLRHFQGSNNPTW